MYSNLFFWYILISKWTGTNVESSVIHFFVCRYFTDIHSYYCDIDSDDIHFWCAVKKLRTAIWQYRRLIHASLQQSGQRHRSIIFQHCDNIGGFYTIFRVAAPPTRPSSRWILVMEDYPVIYSLDKWARIHSVAMIQAFSGVPQFGPNPSADFHTTFRIISCVVFDKIARSNLFAFARTSEWIPTIQQSNKNEQKTEKLINWERKKNKQMLCWSGQMHSQLVWHGVQRVSNAFVFDVRCAAAMS